MRLFTEPLLGLALLFALGAPNGRAAPPDDPYIPVQGSAWHVAVADVTGDGEKELVYATYGGHVRAQDLGTGRVLWSHDLGAFPFAMQARDADGDGRAEVFAATAAGTLHALGAGGQPLWTFRSPLPLYDLAVGDVRPGGGLEVVTGGVDRHVYLLSTDGALIDQSEEVDRAVTRVAAGNLDGDAADEVFVVDAREDAQVLDLEEGQLVQKWQGRMGVPERYVNWENTRGSFFAFSVEIADLAADSTADGAAGGAPSDILLGDAYHNKQAVAVMSAGGEMQWISDKQPAFAFTDEEGRTGEAAGALTGERYTEFYSTAFVRAVEADASHAGREVLSVAGGMVKLFSSGGELLGSANARVGFTDVALDGATAYLGSSPNGDETVYRIDLASTGWAEAVASLERQGKPKEIGETLAQIREQVRAYSGEGPPTEQVYDVRFGGVDPGSDPSQYRRDVAWFEEAFPYDNLRRLFSMKVIEPTPPLDESGEPWSEWRWSVDSIGGTMTVEEIVEAARYVERHEIPTLFIAGHSAMPFITLETAKKILEAAPRYAVGFQTSEDEQIERVPRYMEHFFEPLMDLCAGRDGCERVLTKNKGAWWFSTPALAPVFENLFGAEGREVLTASTEDSNSRTPELNLMARGGLWRAGLIEHNDVSIHRDLFSFNRYHQWEYPKHGHPYFRLMAAHMLLGGDMLSIRTHDVERAEGEEGGEGEVVWSSHGRESTEIIYHMLGKGLLFSPEPEDVAGYSPVGIAVHAPPEKWLTDAHNGHAPEKWRYDAELHEAIVPHNGTLWGMTETPDHALQRVLFQKERQFGSQVPATPYGLVAMVPAHADLDAVPGIERWWHTDGVSVWEEGGEKLTGDAAAEALRASFERAASALPFRSTDRVFLQSIRRGEGRYWLYAIDPGWLTPADRDVRIRAQAGAPVAARDVLTGERIATNGDMIRLTVPAGALRIIEVEVEAR